MYQNNGNIEGDNGIIVQGDNDQEEPEKNGDGNQEDNHEPVVDDNEVNINENPDPPAQEENNEQEEMLGMFIPLPSGGKEE